MRVVELLPFFNEVDVLEARCRITEPYIDQVVVAEGDRTHQGEPKDPVLDSQRPIDSRLCHYLVALPHGEGDEANWVRERAQRDALAQFATALEPDDLVLSCDLDEIVVPYALGRITEATISGPISLGMRMIYYGNREDPRGWQHAKAFRVRDMPRSLSELRLSPCPVVPLVGWHLSYIGDQARRRAKVEAFVHAENRPGTEAWGRIAEAREGPNGEQLVDFDPDELPATLRELV